MPTSSGCEDQVRTESRALNHSAGGDQQPLRDLMGVLCEQRIVVPLDRMDLLLHEFNVLQRQRALINSIVESRGLSDIHTVISRSRGTL